MGSYRVVSGQNIYDVALHLYGSIEGIVDLLMCNPALTLDTVLKVGEELMYTDDFVIDADVVAYNQQHGVIPANGERHIYPKEFTQPPAVLLFLPAAIPEVQCSVSGAGLLEIDWGDNSDTQVLHLSDKPCRLTHTFDSRIRRYRRIRWFTEARFMHIDWSNLHLCSLFLLRPLVVEELTLRQTSLSLNSLELLRETYRLNLAGITTGSLLPLVACRGVMEVDLSGANIRPERVDEYLIALVERYGDRRNCTMTLPAAPSGIYREPAREASGGRYRLTTGMEALWVILHEASWNEGGAWKFIIGETIYTTT